MDAPENDQKTETPTAKRKADAARKGDVLQSRELGTAMIMLAGAAWLALTGAYFFDSCIKLLATGLSIDDSTLENFDPSTAFYVLFPVALYPLAILFAITIIASICAPALLGSLGFRAQGFGFKAEKLNPKKGFARMFGKQGLAELAKSLAKATMLGALGFWIISAQQSQIAGLSGADIKPALLAIGSDVSAAVGWLALGLTAIAFIDVPIQILRRNARLRMSKQEVKEEMRENDGAPEMKQARRQRQHDILFGSARTAVSQATVILTNPTHFAVALRYRPGIDAAPVVVARGRGDVAIAIRELAKDHQIPTLEYPQLTRAIYFTSRAGANISEDLFVAVATILAFVFNIEQALKDGLRTPEIKVPEEKRFDSHGRRLTA
jgi:flagellar biosynthesis protein FlhB